MTRLSPIDPAQATDHTKELLDAWGAYAPLDDMVLTMATSPAMLRSFVEALRSLRRVSLDPRVTERIALTVHGHLGCPRCQAHHRDVAARLGLDGAEIRRALNGTSQDEQVALLLAYARRVLTAPATVTDAELATLRIMGWNEQELIDVVAVVAQNQLTGAFSLVAGLPAPALAAVA